MSERTHIVLIPGFGGFDALGQLEYYAGVTPIFRAWRAGQSRRIAENVALHYFDNLPTAGVKTRAERLRAFLIKRLLRGTFSARDRIVLVGHSTGGLDIRCLLRELQMRQAQAITVDGMGLAAESALPVPVPHHADLLQMLDAVVFLSVPQFGTNIADYVRAYPLVTRAAVETLRGVVAQARFGRGPSWGLRASAVLAWLTRADLFRVAETALETSRVALSMNASDRAQAREDGADLALWLAQIHDDFSAIDDLCAAPYAQAWPGQAQDWTVSPAHYTDQQRAQELRDWNRLPGGPLRTLSFATSGLVPGKHPAARSISPVAPLDPRMLGARTRPGGPDIVYRLCFWACAGGPFELPRPIAQGLPDSIQAWSNDGIVNTASMYWPDGEDTVLVEADHMDIVGHFHGKQRRDLLDSRSAHKPAFGLAEFQAHWRSIFDFSIASMAAAAGAQQ